MSPIGSIVQASMIKRMELANFTSLVAVVIEGTQSLEKPLDTTMGIHRFSVGLHDGSQTRCTAHALLHAHVVFFSSAFLCMLAAVKEGHYDNPALHLDLGSPCCALLGWLVLDLVVATYLHSTYLEMFASTLLSASHFALGSCL